MSIETLTKDDAVYARITLADGKTRVVGYTISETVDASQALRLCARDLAKQVEHFTNTGEWL